VPVIDDTLQQRVIPTAGFISGSRLMFQKKTGKISGGVTIENIKSQKKAKLPKIRLKLDTIHKTTGWKGV